MDDKELNEYRDRVAAEAQLLFNEAKRTMAPPTAFLIAKVAQLTITLVDQHEAMEKLARQINEFAAQVLVLSNVVNAKK